MPKFLSREEVYRLLQRELPEGVYADGAPSAYYTTADMDSVADVVATGYGNLQRIYDNYFPQLATVLEKLKDWEIKMFGYQLPDALTEQQRRDKVIAKVRKQPRIHKWEILTLIASFLPEGKYVQVVELCTDNQKSWSIGESLLGITTLLKFDENLAETLGIDVQKWCEFVSTKLHWRLSNDGLGDTTYLAEYSWTDIASIQKKAFGYEIRIFDYTFSAADFLQVDKEVTAAEPARSAHFWKQNQDLTVYGLTNVVPDVNQFSLVDCITRDSGSTTGYTGRTT